AWPVPRNHGSRERRIQGAASTQRARIPPYSFARADHYASESTPADLSRGSHFSVENPQPRIRPFCHRVACNRTKGRDALGSRAPTPSRPIDVINRGATTSGRQSRVVSSRVATSHETPRRTTRIANNPAQSYLHWPG